MQKRDAFVRLDQFKTAWLIQTVETLATIILGFACTLGLAGGAAASKLLKGQADLEYQHISNVSYLRSFLFLSFLNFVGFLDPDPVTVHILAI
jgi:hypothetical protein